VLSTDSYKNKTKCVFRPPYSSLSIIIGQHLKKRKTKSGNQMQLQGILQYSENIPCCLLFFNSIQPCCDFSRHDTCFSTKREGILCDRYWIVKHYQCQEQLCLKCRLYATLVYFVHVLYLCRSKCSKKYVHGLSLAFAIKKDKNENCHYLVKLM